MKVLVDSIGQIELLDKDFVDSGGEGNIYIKNNVAFKIYHDKNKMIPVQKIEELQSLTLDNIIKPEKVIYSVNREPVGYTMKVLKDYYPLSRIITNDFRQQHNIDNDKILNLVIKMRQTIEHIHEKGFLFVDANEMNFLVSKDFSDVYFIDDDSYKTKKTHATAYTELALDPNIDINNHKSFTKETDWYSFAVLACKIFSGIHPFKGKFKDKSKMNVKDRMKNYISIFNNKISIPKTARDLNDIPSNFKKWFIEIFEKNNRILPPSNIEAIYYNKKENRLIQDILSFIKIKDFSDNINYITSFDSHLFVKTCHYIEDVNSHYKPKDLDNTYPLYSFIHGDLFVKKENKKLVLFRIKDSKVFNSEVEVDDFFVKDNLIVGVNNDKLLEIILFENNNKLNLAVKSATNIFKNSLKRFNNVYINKLYEKNIIIVPIGNGVFLKEAIPELEHCSILNAKYQNHILGVTYFNIHKELVTEYFRYNTSLNRKESILKLKEKEIDFVVNFSGVVVINDKEKIILFSNKFESNSSKEVEDKNLSQFRLYSDNQKIFAISNNSLYTMTMN